MSFYDAMLQLDLFQGTPKTRNRSSNVVLWIQLCDMSFDFEQVFDIFKSICSLEQQCFWLSYLWFVVGWQNPLNAGVISVQEGAYISHSL